ncbi:MAG: hypothetical protein WBP72_00290 [Rhodocyclaceae bacterium]
MTHRLLARVGALGVACAALPLSAIATPDADIKALREQLKDLKQNYEQRIDALEKRLADAEKSVGKAENTSQQAQEVAQQAARRPAAESAFNPGISLILNGTYTRQGKDPESYRIDGFMPSNGEVGPPPRSFSLGESELAISANIDPWFRGQLMAALTPDDSVEVEEAYIQTLALSHGLTLKAGRFFSGVGYLNEQHAHAWDFSDAPLPYKAFFGNKLGSDGVQLKWVAPTDTFLELGAEAARGGSFPSTDRNKNGSTLGAAFAHVGGDLGASHSWRAGLSYLRTSPKDRTFDDGDATQSFSGRSRTAIADFVWKWAPNGNATHTSFKLQGEYFRRKETGTLASDSGAGACGGDCSGAFSSRQSGWYLQGVYQFMPQWRVGLRHDRLHYGSMDIGLIADGTLAQADLPLLTPYSPRRNTAMVDWTPSEYSRVRLQLAQDKSRLGETDNQVWLQYIMSLGAHGAHAF